MKPLLYNRVQDIMFDALRELEDRILMGTGVKILTFHLTSTIQETGQIMTRFISGYNKTIRQQYIRQALNHFHFSEKNGKMPKSFEAFDWRDVPLRTLANKDYHEHPYYYRALQPIKPELFSAEFDEEFRFRKGRHWPTRLPIVDESPGLGFAFTVRDSPDHKTDKMLHFFKCCLELHCSYARSFMWITQPHVDPHTYYLDRKKKLYNSIIITFSDSLDDELMQYMVAKRARDFIVQYLLDFYLQSILAGGNAPVPPPVSPPIGPQQNDKKDTVKFLYTQLYKSNPEYARLILNDISPCLRDLIEKNTWRTPLSSRLERIRVIADQVDEGRMGIDRFMDNLRARWLALALYLVFDWTVYKVKHLVVNNWEYNTVQSMNRLAGREILREFNRFVFIDKIKNDYKVKKARENHLIEPYWLNIVNALSEEECRFLKITIEQYGKESAKIEVLKALKSRLGLFQG